MTTNVKVFKSTDAGAPTVSGTAAHLLAILDGILVDGYNSKTITLARTDTTATATSTAHGFIAGQCVLIAGADQSEYNGEKYILTVTDNTFTFAVAGSPATPATGTITAKMAPAGWTASYTGTNKKAYRTGGGNQRYLRVDDSTSTSARVAGYEAMTDVDTGTNPFPTAAQVSGGLYINKSSVADTNGRAWVAAATDRLLILWINAGTSTGAVCGAYVFGDTKTFAAADQFATVMIAATSYSATAVASYQFASSTAAYGTTVAGNYMARSYTQVGGSIAIGKHGDAAKAKSLTAFLGGAGLTYPSETDGGLYLTPVYAHEANALRGTIPGLWGPLHARPLTCLDTVSGSGALAGKSFIALNTDGSSPAAANGQLFLETSNTWDI
jgi:hypothetical protein